MAVLFMFLSLFLTLSFAQSAAAAAGEFVQEVYDDPNCETQTDRQVYKLNVCYNVAMCKFMEIGRIIRSRLF
jgi:hypothetical protein